jgi:Tfp pilus assembly protein PilO
MTMSRTNQILIAVVAVVGAACAFYFLSLAPKREELTRLDTDIAAKQAEVEAAEQQLASYEAARASYKKNYATLARLGKAVPGDDDVRSLLVQLESAADRTGVDFQNIELGGALGGASASDATPAAGELAAAPGSVPVAGGVLSAMPFTFTFNGEYFDLSKFLSHLERFVTVSNERIDVTGRLLRLESIQLQPGPAGFPNMQAQIGAATYIVPPTEGLPGADAAAAAPPAGTQATPGATPPTTTANATGAS